MINHPHDDRARAEYFEQFEYRLEVTLGPTWGPDYQEFLAWCQQHLGPQFKNWFIISGARGQYTLWCRSSKWASFLALTWVDKISARA